MTDSVDRRRWARFPLEAEVAFRRPREPHYQIGVNDLTPQGCRVTCPERLEVGDLVWVQLPTLESLPSWVRWASPAQSGVEFDRPLHEAVFDMMAARLSPAAA